MLNPEPDAWYKPNKYIYYNSSMQIHKMGKKSESDTKPDACYYPNQYKIINNTDSDAEP